MIKFIINVKFKVKNLYSYILGDCIAVIASVCVCLCV